jgi:hypothetical protein
VLLRTLPFKKMERWEEVEKGNKSPNFPASDLPIHCTVSGRVKDILLHLP